MPGKPFSRVRSAAIDGRAGNQFFKKTQLAKLHEALVAGAADIQKAIQKDTGHSLAEARVEYWLALRCLAQVYDGIDPDTEHKREYRVADGKDAPDAREPVGIVVIEPTTHTFLYSLVCALAPAIAAGNCVVVQMDRSMLETPKLVLALVKEALDADTFDISYTTVTGADLGHRHRKILQNGSTEAPLANHVVSEAQNRVVAVVERDADLDAAARSLVAARFGLRGTSPYAPDVVLVNEWVKKDFLAAVSRHALALTSPTPKNTPPTLVKQILKDGSGSVLSTASSGALVDVEDRQSGLLQQKIKEPCMLVHSVTSMDDAIDVATGLGRLSAAYVFASPGAAKYICQFVDAGVCFANHLPMKLLYGPVAPSDHAPSPDALTPYDVRHFTLPKAQFIEPTEAGKRLDKLVLEPTGLALRNLNDEAKAGLRGMVRPKKGGDIGFFNQGIVTGGILVLSTALSCTGLLCYYLVRVARAAM